MELIINSKHLMISAMFGYFLGSIPFGLLLTYIGGFGDVRSIGSGNIGTTNVLRTGNKKLAAMTLFFDAIKATVSIFIATAFFDKTAAILAGFCAFIGHIFPLWLHCKGGKGVATYVGTILGLNAYMAIIFSIIWLSCAILTRYSSFASLFSTLMVMIISWTIKSDPILAMTLTCMTIIVWIKHKGNIQRLINKKEEKISFVKKYD
ncbi:Acyl-phosphate:glycerol-3-phosphate O-acyltransferase PlsY [Liberibacter crescens BT-1]|uniref:Glycerol-3-phosphate acyltransferase n=1 Tax=Liberibacter crescens (strain BT-1) TaxID=1215343 RepID=L0ETT1_LIBCB|nr:glycerol-3-phosphate 1-O-acyltransferase PlsY [Liberibacter crescens]AGA64949.1 Acyl-phosphate:glycerol-3-phosphate O-acyltransferase PlsY [Liberibacter crescens BT-1]AMC12970.1 glycerol-3-phosphate acyltransferase [Liberibacter crescens]